MLRWRIAADSPRDRWLNDDADDSAAERTDPVDEQVLVYRSAATPERSDAGHQWV